MPLIHKDSGYTVIIEWSHHNGPEPELFRLEQGPGAKTKPATAGFILSVYLKAEKLFYRLRCRVSMLSSFKSQVKYVLLDLLSR